ncbi:endolytic transglycosylase MltG [Patescibacteria group bacterium]|nr:endolytic transglycosylase MltG [Patescibacteria group bacterium]MBU3999858.1 endolytic transglycosylase MltG [Patescibacteria group bacterium]MBU4057220.1 endolytic transglycosylase MltG [Patescibacteria group bacterium]MBU4368674.1 endolytic transglycosylase MltG [Patescibacteria group bacterium]
MPVKKTILSIITLLTAAVIFFAGAYLYIQKQAETPFNEFGFYKNFKISFGESVEKIAENLAYEGLIKNDFYFMVYVWEKNLAASIMAGEYYLSPAMSIGQIAGIITGGKAIGREITVLIPEGLTSAESERILVGANLINKSELIEAIKKENLKKYPNYEFLKDKPARAGLEGYLFPDTYRFFKDAKPEDIVIKMLENFDKKFTEEMRLGAPKQGETIFEVLTLASIIQKEVSDSGDMKIVAGIFKNRLSIGMALEADSTINFITGKKMPQATLNDLKIDSAYNTYKYPGLPTGPISNPGLTAIKAAIWPEKTPYWYFLTAPDGKAVYSKTYEEHLKNKAKYLR